MRRLIAWVRPNSGVITLVIIAVVAVILAGTLGGWTSVAHAAPSIGSCG